MICYIILSDIFLEVSSSGFRMIEIFIFPQFFDNNDHQKIAECRYAMKIILYLNLRKPPEIN